MLKEIIPFSEASESTFDDVSRSERIAYVREMQQHAGETSEQFLDHFAEEPRFDAQHRVVPTDKDQEEKEKTDPAPTKGHSLFQELFFFCRVKKVGNLPGVECIYVETVVDGDSGLAFAKVYPTKSALNAVDILSTRVVPYFERRGIAIQEIHTRKTSEYCGLLPTHPFESFLATSHIRHLEMWPSSRPCNYSCEQFYRLLLKEFFPLALRRSFQLSFADLQRQLDDFLEAHNAAQSNGKTK